MFTLIRDSDINTPLMKRVEEQLLKKQTALDNEEEAADQAVANSAHDAVCVSLANQLMQTALDDDIHIMFEDESPDSTSRPQKKKKDRRKSRRSMDFTPRKPVLLQDTSDSQTPQNAVTCDVSSGDFSTAVQQDVGLQDAVAISECQPLKKRRRQSADLEVITIPSLVVSPDIELDGLAEIQSLPGTRKSRRLRRQSIDMCRKQAKTLSSPYSFTDAVLNGNGCMEIERKCGNVETSVSPIPDSPITPVTYLHDIYDDKELDDISHSPVTAFTQTADTVESCAHINSELLCPDKTGASPSNPDFVSGVSEGVLIEETARSNSALSGKEISDDNSSEPDGGSGDCIKSRKRRVGKDEAPAACTTRKHRKKKDTVSSSVEDIYLNRLWRSQMPRTDKPWETIYEEPDVDKKSGSVKYMSGNRSKRMLNQEEFFTQQKLKKRRQKAKKLGYKPPTKKKREALEKLVTEKLSTLDALLNVEETVATADQNVVEEL